ncbi:MAG: radical SAM protein, partial [Deltaproteobacteria bacterium]|nr:radical SAM protein [Deltaproteobacteria bacterium]
THVVTNGSLLKGDLLEAVSESGISEISISIDGLDKLHDQNRKKGAFKAALGAIKALNKRSRPSVTCSTTIGYWNASDLRSLTELMDSLSVPQRFMFYQDYPIASQKMGEGNLTPSTVEEITSFVRYYLKNHYDELLPFAPSFFKARLEGKQFSPPILKEPCTLPSYYVNVLWQGEVFPCLGMRSTLYPGVGITGTVRNFSITEQKGLLNILRSPEYSGMQTKLRGCQECCKFFASRYVRPRLSFPLGNFMKYRLLKIKNINNLHP